MHVWWDMIQAAGGSRSSAPRLRYVGERLLVGGVLRVVTPGIEIIFCNDREGLR